MKKTTVLQTALTFSVLPLVGWSSDRLKDADETRHPNVIFVLSDDQGYGDFGCFGNPYVDTPNMDRLYNESTRLTDFYVCPACAPTRASLLTGRYNYRASIWDTWRGGCNMNTEEFTIAEAMKEAGYKTALFGKWHLGYNYPLRPQDQGFDEVLLWDLFHKEKENRNNPVMIHNGQFVETQGFEDDIVFDYAIDWMKKNQSSDQPFFMYVASCLPHTWVDYQIPPEYVKKYEKYPEISAYNAEILAMVDKLDENLGRLLDSMDELGLTQDTVVIYTSDNGPQFDLGQSRSNMNMRGYKTLTYEGGIKLPCFIRWPDVLPAGKDIQQVGVSVDFMPTVLELCGIDVKLPNKLDGISLWPHISGATEKLIPRTFCGQFHRSDDVLCPWETSYIRDGDWKLVNGCELYNLAEDPSEKTDLSRQQSKRFWKLRKKYDKWYADVTSESAEFGEFRVNPTIIGTEHQQLTNLRYSNANPKHGWPMQIVDPGPYRITVNHMQNDLFDQTSEFQLHFGDQIISKKILPNEGALVFDNVNIIPGTYDMKPVIGGTFNYRVYRTNRDIGYRNIYIERLDQ